MLYGVKSNLPKRGEKKIHFEIVKYCILSLASHEKNIVATIDYCCGQFLRHAHWLRLSDPVVGWLHRLHGLYGIRIHNGIHAMHPTIGCRQCCGGTYDALCSVIGWIGGARAL